MDSMSRRCRHAATVLSDRMPIVVRPRLMRSPRTSDAMRLPCRGQDDDHPPRRAIVQLRSP